MIIITNYYYLPQFQQILLSSLQNPKQLQFAIFIDSFLISSVTTEEVFIDH